MKDERVARPSKASSRGAANMVSRATKEAFVEDIRQGAATHAKIVSYAQGYMLMREAAKDVRLESELRRDRADVARRLHHPQRVSWQDQESVR